ncbi:excalibur calcium-binding domain-containing protein [Paenibacillus sp. Marseille-Q4541]|uniref:excalibur calcium-binding domain-containing protein n=1 Tax=Paenibacillus sp. Marseille-Q4541 TaxID=2831522 RepID=UPI00201A1EF7|nr:excalibur calcium-binding domain-containing protein [Paenibacillus sp. Marseille-Q4541]
MVSASMSLGAMGVIHAESAKKYKNCTELNKVYKGGVAKSSSVKNKGGKTKYKPHVSAALYKANSSKDRDNDGIACEK